MRTTPSTALAAAILIFASAPGSSAPQGSSTPGTSSPVVWSPAVWSPAQPAAIDENGDLPAVRRSRASGPVTDTSPPRVLAATVGIDNRHGFAASAILASGSSYSDFRATISGLGMAIVPLTSFTAADLVGLDAVMVKQPYTQNGTGFSATEIADLQAFVAAGGGLFVHAEGGSGSDALVANLTTLVSPWGIGFAAAASQGTGWTINAVVPHAVTTGVTSFGVDYQRILTTINAPTIDLTPGGGADDALAVSDQPGACVVVVSDASLWTDAGAGADTPITFADNRRLLENIANFIVTGCVPATCGDGILDASEACDDGNLDPLDLCANDCTLTLCGDALLQVPNGQGTGGPLGNGEEACDDGNTDPTDLCLDGCILSYCGDGFLQPQNGEGTGGTTGTGDEACDDSNTDPTDLCLDDCSLSRCGDGFLQAQNGEGTGGTTGVGDEACDEGGVATPQCNLDCTFTSCGDGVVQSPNGDGTGGTTGSGDEACDDGGVSTPQCNLDCTFTSCGDGVVQSPNGDGTGGTTGTGDEACDEGGVATPQCNLDCTLTSCGDGVVQSPNGDGTGGTTGVGDETCDAGGVATPQCNLDCTVTTCGDGVLQAPNGSGLGGPANDGVEECDDGNSVPNDGCTSCSIDIVLDVEWLAIEAVCEGDGVRVTWSVANELDNYGYRVRRGESSLGVTTEIGDPVWATGPYSSYELFDASPLTGARWYRIEELCHSGTDCELSPPVQAIGCASGGTAGGRDRPGSGASGRRQ